MRILRVVVLFVLLLGFWLLLSGHYDPLFVTMGVVSAAATTWFGASLLERSVGPATAHPRIHLFWLLVFVVWLVGKMVVGAIQVARIVLDPRFPPRPGVTQFRTQLSTPAARSMLANAITLVPGTITLEMEGDLLTVHSFIPDSVTDLADGTTQNRIAAVFRDVDQPAPDLHWELGEAPRDTDPEAQEGFDAPPGADGPGEEGRR
jgi:multicomponent Na+:H+ antiporter subunit E